MPHWAPNDFASESSFFSVLLTNFRPEHLVVREEAAGELACDPAIDLRLLLVAGAADLVGVASAVVAGGERCVAEAIAEQPRLRQPPEHGLQMRQERARRLLHKDPLPLTELS